MAAVWEAKIRLRNTEERPKVAWPWKFGERHFEELVIFCGDNEIKYFAEKWKDFVFSAVALVGWYLGK
jgi:hypothetical protein